MPGFATVPVPNAPKLSDSLVHRGPLVNRTFRKGGPFRTTLEPAEIAMFRISEVQEAPAFNGGRSFLTLRVQCFLSRSAMTIPEMPAAMIKSAMP